jgi:hypothetical protein
VIGGGARPRPPGAQHAREELLGVATRPQRVESEGPLERLGGRLLLAVGGHDSRVDIEHHHIAARSTNGLEPRSDLPLLGSGRSASRSLSR